MLQVSFISENKEKVLKGLNKRYFTDIELIDEILILDNKRKKIQFELNKILTQSNQISDKISSLLKHKNQKDVDILYQYSIKFKKQVKILNNNLTNIIQNLNEKLIQIPNIPSEKVKKGKNFNENENIYQEGDISNSIDNPFYHWDLVNKFQLFNFNLGIKISGNGFPVYIGKGARLQRSLIQYFLDQNIKAGYLEYGLPYLVNEKSGYSTGQIPDKEGQMYHIKKDNLYLIPTGEISLINCYRDQILLYSELPIKATAHTPCFRREAGSYGKNVRGLNRLHQFDKVEIIQITTPENSYKILGEMVEHVKLLLQKLKLPFRILRLCSGDLGFTSSITYDFEVYSLVQKKWLEVSSVSNCTNFQTYRLKLRYRLPNGKLQFCHTLNGSALALPRIMAVLLENNQTIEEIKIPKVLIPYTGFSAITFP